ncbi:hypothetical protein P4O66_016754 [Electrophorus voltai]|uniref:Uncharacterized protein n=1 Tax=Electrophorus voltai TaxID=2609070 RepID=A0AAD9DPF8_9TELE|nr:hypothetical protein P4O66_016754 [Electrophorus voltai]
MSWKISSQKWCISPQWKNHCGRKLQGHHLISNDIVAEALGNPESWLGSPKDFTEGTLFYVNQEFLLIKNRKVKQRGEINLIGHLKFTMRKEKNDAIIQYWILITQQKTSEHIYSNDLPMTLFTGGHYSDQEDEEEDYKCPIAERAGGDPGEYVSSPDEDDQGAE